jgi:hypothetical protein
VPEPVATLKARHAAELDVGTQGDRELDGDEQQHRRRQQQPVAYRRATNAVPPDASYREADADDGGGHQDRGPGYVHVEPAEVTPKTDGS